MRLCPVNEMKPVCRHFFYLLSLLLIVFSPDAFARCSLINNSRDALFITYERSALVRVKGENKPQDGVILRLRNNSTCAVIITTASADKFYKPLPANPTALQRVEREIDDLPDGALVPDVQYRYQTSRETGMTFGGDSFFGLKLLGSRSILFEVPLKHFDITFAGKIVLEFDYAREQENRAKVNYPNVETFVNYWAGELPEDVRQKMKRGK